MSYGPRAEAQAGNALDAEGLAAAVELLAQRGYALPASALGALLGAQAPGEETLRAARADPRLEAHAGFVVPAGRADLVAPSRLRHDAHAAATARWLPVAASYARALARHVPWVRCVLACGSLGSGGMRETDDLDVSLVVEDGTKHLAYIAALAVALPFAWRHRRRPHEASARLPLVPKLVCINVVWTQSETRPFLRRDDMMALELALSTPLHGAARWREILAENRDLAARFPYALARAPLADVTARPSSVSRALARLARPPRVRSVLDTLAYGCTRLLVALVAWWRRRDAPTRGRVARLERLKRPYALLDRPGRSRG